MKIILSLAALLGFFGLVNYNVQKSSRTLAKTHETPPAVSVNETSQISRVKEKTPVLVELFTSEGCATCPPADKTLALLEKEQPNADAEIITLALHVDYWNRLGWKDEFSSPLYSQRQSIYGQKFRLNSIYTPQMIVDGARQFAGGNLAEAQKAISEAAKTPKAKIELGVTGEQLKIKISEIPAHQNATVFLAVAEDNLTSNVKRGENTGRILEHISVVRRLQPFGKVLMQENFFELETVLQTEANWKRENLKFVVFLQENQTRRVLGVNFLKPKDK